MKQECKKLTPQQERFCHEYLKDRNGTQAAIRAKYSRKTAQAQSSRLLTNVMLRARVNQLVKEQLDRIKIRSDFVIRELLNSATINIKDAYDEGGNLLPLEFMPEQLQKAIVEIRTEELFDGRGEEREQIGTAKTIKVMDRFKSLEAIGKHLKMFTDVVEHRGLDNLADQIKKARQRRSQCQRSLSKKKK
jgi:phage terminase small subunit